MVEEEGGAEPEFCRYEPISAMEGSISGWIDFPKNYLPMSRALLRW
jgi:hypothetical protein